MKKKIIVPLVLIGILGFMFLFTGCNKEEVKKEDGYTNDQLCQMALDYYEKNNGYRPGKAAAQAGEDGKVVIQLYDQLSDHNSTSDWYTVDAKTGKGTNILGESIDLSTVAKK